MTQTEGYSWVNQENMNPQSGAHKQQQYQQYGGGQQYMSQQSGFNPQQQGFQGQHQQGSGQFAPLQSRAPVPFQPMYPTQVGVWNPSADPTTQQQQQNTGARAPPGLTPGQTQFFSGAPEFYPQSMMPGNFVVTNSAAQLAAKSVDKTKRYEGVIKTYNLASGFGFISCQEIYALFERDVFFNRAVEGADRIEVSQQVSFLVEISDKQQPQAREVKLLTPSGSGAAAKRAPPVDQLFQGLVRTYNSNLGYGFITCHEIKDQYDRDVFVHKQQYIDAELEIGDRVEFKVVMNSKGQPQARDLEKAVEPVENEAYIEPPNGQKKFRGRLRDSQVEKSGFAFLDSEDAHQKFGHADIFLHKSHCPKNAELLAKDWFEFDVVMVRGRPQARNIANIENPSEE